MPILREDVLRKICRDVFFATGIPEEDAHIVADQLVNNHLAGHDSHGTWFVPMYTKRMRSGYRDWEEHEVLRDTPCLRIIDGHGADGIVACTRAADLAVEKARKATFGFIGLRNVSHIGRLGDYTPRIAQQGMLGIVGLNGGGLFMAPFGSADRRLRPEPISIAAPRRNGPPFMLDMSMTGVAGGKIAQKIVRGEPVPDGWLINHDGNYENRASKYREPETCALLPLGGLQFGHKGYGLAMMVEMMVGPLTHAGCTKGSGEGDGGDGVMILAINIEAFTDLETYTDEVERLREWVCSARPLPGFGSIYAPGEIEEETRRQRLEGGIDLPDQVWSGIVQTAGELGVVLPVT
jgi:LDH2 family malate/lactate/ureidoglycolate dehydrogenase